MLARCARACPRTLPAALGSSVDEATARRSRHARASPLPLETCCPSHRVAAVPVAWRLRWAAQSAFAPVTRLLDPSRKSRCECQRSACACASRSCWVQVKLWLSQGGQPSAAAADGTTLLMKAVAAESPAV
eukprot:2969371-Pleurochrysis_carterae.AAC.1